MIILNEEELASIIGGVSISSGIINSFVKAISIALEVGRSFGTVIRRGFGNGICSIR